MNHQPLTATTTIRTRASHTIRQTAQRLRPHLRKAKRAARRGAIHAIRWYRSLRAINQGRLQGAVACALACAIIVATRPASVPWQMPVAPKLAAVPTPVPVSKTARIVEKQTAPKPKAEAPIAATKPKTVSDEAMQGLFKVIEQNKKAQSQQSALSDSQALAMHRAQLLQQQQMQIQQQAQTYQHQAQQGASEAAHYEMQRYRRQMTGRPGF